MSEHCVAIEELERVLELPAADPRRLHVESCARCRSLAGMLAEFAGAAAAPAEAGFAAADARLRDTIAELTGIREGDPDAAAEPTPRAAVRSAFREPRASWWNFGALRPALAFAALLVVTSAGVLLWRANAPAPVMRDAGNAAFTASASPSTAGVVEIAWTPVAGADGYRVLFLDASLREVARIDGLAAAPAELRADTLPPGLAHGAEVVWQVEALSGSDRLALSGARTLRVP